MKNLEYIRKYELWVSEEEGKRPIDNPDNQRKFIQDFYFDYISTLEVAGEELSIKKYDQIYRQMLQKLDSLSKKTPYGIPDKFYRTLDGFYFKFLKRFCSSFYNKIEEIKTWNYTDTYSAERDKFIEFFRVYKFNHFRNPRGEDFEKYPKIVKIAFEIYSQKKKEYQEKERIKREKRWNYQRSQNSYEFFGSFFGGFGFDFNDFISRFIKENPVNSFSVLGLSKDANIEDVKGAYRKLSMEYHPDRGGNSEKFIEITEAKNKCLMYLGEI